MKKIVFILVLLLFTAPALATNVTIDANQVGDTNEVVITYFSDGNLPRGFGLDITVTDGNIVACIPAMEGECTDSDRGFGIFPSTIVIDDTPPQAVIIFAGNPVSTIQPALGGLDTNGVTIELGSLYQEPNSPPLGTESDPIVLCTIVVTEDCIVRIKGNAARCGEGSPAYGVVMENPDEIPIVVFGIADVNIDDGPGPCFPSDHPDYDEWVLVGEPNSWCYTYQCYGDADGKQGGDPFSGYFYVEYADLNALIASWKKPTTDPAFDISADFSRSEDGDPFSGYFRVEYKDLNIVIANWKDDSGLAADCGGDLSPP